ncbi:MAG: hydrogenase formation protein HypD, partial [Proteobacteria bacterium]|nr:hydrogenase formation protein HypD [Pseudomonadota bacterium]
MEVCGTHTMAAARAGLRSILPENIGLISGPGCPVCVTDIGYVDHALALAARPNLIIATFGDLMRVPGSVRGNGPAPNLIGARARGAHVEVVYSPLDAVNLAQKHPSSEVVFLGVGFETTAPTVAAAILRAKSLGLTNFSVLSAHKTIPEAMVALVSTGDLALDGFLCPGHVSIILGPEPYKPLAATHGIPCAIAGFEVVEILRGMAALVQMVVKGEPQVVNCYAGAVRPGGNTKARDIMYEVFAGAHSVWRGLGTIPHSGLTIRGSYESFDAACRFDVDLPEPIEPRECRCGDVLRGAISPDQCPLFGQTCTPDNPRGACMVSSEGS